MLSKFASFFRSLAARSMDRAFVQSSISTQLHIVKFVKDCDPKDRLLYDPAFISSSVRTIGPYKVAVSPTGEEAVLLLPAQETFTADYYLRFVSSEQSVARVCDKVYLKAGFHSTQHTPERDTQLQIIPSPRTS